MKNSQKSYIQKEVTRYSQKGLSLIPAFLIALAYLTLYPLLLKSHWTNILELCGFNGDYNNKMFKFKMCVLLQGVAHIMALVIFNTMFMVIYKCKLPLFEQYKINPDRAWPWDKDYQEWQKIVKKSLWQVMFNATFVHFGLIAFDIFITEDVKMDMSYEFPSLGRLIGQMIYMALIEDILFYWAHRLLHHPSIYPSIHKQHHQYKDTVSIASEYSHPLETIFSNILPSVIGYKLLTNSIHQVTISVWIVARILESIDGHSGYDLPWSPFRLLPCSASSSFHDYHHTTNIGNYGSLFSIWDTICNTNKSYNAFQIQKDKEKQKNKSE